MAGLRYTISDEFILDIVATGPHEEARWAESYSVENVDEGIHLSRFDYSTESEQLFRGDGPPNFCIAVFLSGPSAMSVEDGPVLLAKAGTTVLFHAPRPVSGKHILLADTRTQVLDIRFTPKALNAFAVTAPMRYGQPGRVDASVGDVLLAAIPTTPTLNSIARSIYSCPYSGPARQLYLRAKTMEALAHVLAGEPADKDGDTARMSERDRRWLIDAEVLLSDKFAESWTISKLARAVGVNEQKLKTGFRTQLGATVHQFLENRRMQEAAILLAEGMPVTEAAFAVGYQNMSHFAKRFSQHFGILPRDWRKKAN